MEKRTVKNYSSMLFKERIYPKVTSSKIVNSNHSSAFGLCFIVLIIITISSILSQDLICIFSQDLGADRASIHAGFTHGSPPWTAGVIPYVFDSTIVERTREICIDAFREWEESTPLVFPPRTNEKDYLLIVDSGNSPSFSAVGMKGGRQRLYIAQPAYYRNILHELGHVIGLHHEHQRSDRDQYIEIFAENLSGSYSSNITTVISTINYTPYDFLSIMHYPRNALSGNGKNTIVPREEHIAYLDLMGTQNKVSNLDKIAVSKMYSGIPALVSPADGADQQPHTGITLEWSTFPDALEYQIQVSRSPSFETTVIDETTIALDPTPPISIGTQTYITRSLDKGQMYYWRIRTRTSTDLKSWSDYSSFQVSDYILRQNYPNPFNPGTTIEFILSRDSNVKLKIFNLLGEEVTTLISEDMPAGLHSIWWDASQFAAGVYLYWLKAGDAVEVRKMILMM